MSEAASPRTEALVVVLCKPPGSSQCKTRLAADIGREQASAWYARSLQVVLETVGALGAPVRVSVDGRPLALAAIARATVPDAELMRQVGDSFGWRQAHEIQRGLADGYACVVLVASDLVGLTTAALSWAIAVARRGRVAVVPSPDGGYAMVGTSTSLPELGRTPMSADDTLSALVASLDGNGKKVRLAEFMIPDIDRGIDLERWTAAVPPPGEPGPDRWRAVT